MDDRVRTRYYQKVEIRPTVHDEPYQGKKIWLFDEVDKDTSNIRTIDDSDLLRIIRNEIITRKITNENSTKDYSVLCLLDATIDNELENRDNSSYRILPISCKSGNPIPMYEDKIRVYERLREALGSRTLKGQEVILLAGYLFSGRRGERIDNIGLIPKTPQVRESLDKVIKRIRA